MLIGIVILQLALIASRDFNVSMCSDVRLFAPAGGVGFLAPIKLPESGNSFLKVKSEN